MEDLDHLGCIKQCKNLASQPRACSGEWAMDTETFYLLPGKGHFKHELGEPAYY